MTFNDENQSQQLVTNKTTILLISDGVDMNPIVAVRSVLRRFKINCLIVAYSSPITSLQGNIIVVDQLLPIENSIEYDALFIADGHKNASLFLNNHAVSFINNAYKNDKVIALAHADMVLINKGTSLHDDEFLKENIITYSSHDNQFFKRFMHKITKNKMNS